MGTERDEFSSSARPADPDFDPKLGEALDLMRADHAVFNTGLQELSQTLPRIFEIQPLFDLDDREAFIEMLREMGGRELRRIHGLRRSSELETGVALKLSRGRSYPDDRTTAAKTKIALKMVHQYRFLDPEDEIHEIFGETPPGQKVAFEQS